MGQESINKSNPQINIKSHLTNHLLFYKPNIMFNKFELKQPNY